MERYCFCLNFFSSADNCWVVKGVLGLRLGLCFLSVPILIGPVGGFNVKSAKDRGENRLWFRVRKRSVRFSSGLIGGRVRRARPTLLLLPPPHYARVTYVDEIDIG